MSRKNAKTNEPTEEEKRATELRQMKKNNPTSLKEDIFRLRQQLSDILQKKSNLEKEIETKTEDYIEKTFKIETEIKKQEDELIRLEEKLATQKENFEEQMKKNKKNWQEELQQIIKNNERIKCQKIQEKKQWEQKIKHLRQYPQRKIQYQMTIAKLDAQLERMRICQEKDINNIHSQHEKKRVQAEKHTQQQIKNIKEHEVNKLEEKMTKEQHIKKENDLMEKEIDLCESQKKILEDECETLKVQIENEKTKMSKDILGGQANETYERSLRIIQLQGKITKLKTYLGEETARLEKEFEKLDDSYSKQEEEIKNKMTKIQGWIRIKERDLKKLKACSQMVLNQRSTLESYLLQVFYEHPQIDNKDERNMNKILRYLFVKINSKKPPVNYKNFLHQSNSMMSSINSNS